MVLFLELLVIAVLVGFTVMGMRRGLVMSLLGLAGVLVAFIGAGVLANSLAPAVGSALEPRFAAAIEEQLNESLQHTEFASESGGVAATPDEVALPGVLEVLREMGLYEPLIDSIDRAVENGMTQAAASAAARVAAALAQSVAYLILFVLGFVLILILWKAVSRALDLVARLPVLHSLNKTLGAAFGLLQGCLFLFLAAWALQFMGQVIPPETVEQTVLLRFFLTTNPVSLLTGQ